MCNNASETTLSAKLCQCRINVPGKGTHRRRMIHQELIEWIRREFFIFCIHSSLSHSHKLYSKVLKSFPKKINYRSSYFKLECKWEGCTSSDYNAIYNVSKEAGLPYTSRSFYMITLLVSVYDDRSQQPNDGSKQTLVLRLRSGNNMCWAVPRKVTHHKHRVDKESASVMLMSPSSTIVLVFSSVLFVQN